ncbi:hypothetical protein ACLOJK_019888 [Asimina triloba]
MTRLESHANNLPVATLLPDRTPVALPRRRDQSPLPQGMTSADLRVSCYGSINIAGMLDELQEHVEAIDIYRAAILDSHPDKLLDQFETSDTKHGLRERFLQVQKAWEILGDSASHAVYDRKLQASIQDFEVADDVELEEMMVDDSGEFSELFYQCRCGDYISIDSEELGEIGFFLERNGGKELQTISGMPASVVLPCGVHSKNL